MRRTWILIAVALAVALAIAWSRVVDVPPSVVVSVAPPSGAGDGDAALAAAAATAEQGRVVRTPDRRRHWILAELDTHRRAARAIGVGDDAVPPSLAGRVAWQGDGLPIEGARISLTKTLLDTVVPTVRRPGPVVDPKLPVATTDAYGRFVLDPVYSDANLFLCVEHGDLLREVRKIERLPRTGERLELGDLAIARRGGIRGRVVLPRGAGPAAGVLVRAIDDHFFREQPLRDELAEARFDGADQFVRGAWFEHGLVGQALAARDAALPFVEARTDARGEFRLIGVRPGRAWLVAQATDPLGSLQSEVVVVADRSTDVGVITLERAVPFDVTLVPPEAGIEVTAVAAGATLGPLPVLTDRRGRARLGLPVASGRAAREALTKARFEVLYRRGSDMPWESSPGHRLPRATVQARPLTSMRIAADVTGEDVVVLVRDTAGDVAAEEVEFGVWETTGLLTPSRPLLVVLFAPGFAPAVEALPRPKNVEMVLEPAFDQLVEVVDERGAPLEGASVRVRFDSDRSSDAPPGRDWAALERWFPLGRSDVTGRVRVPDLWRTRMTFVAEHRDLGIGRLVATPRRDGGALRIVVPRIATLRGLVTRDGREPSSERWFVGVRGAWFSRETLAMADGSFELPSVPPGSYEVYAREPDLPRTQRRRRSVLDAVPSAPPAIKPALRRTVDLAPGELEYVDLVVESARDVLGRITGRVRVDGAFTAGLRVLVVSPRPHALPRPVETDGFGQFELRATRGVRGPIDVQVRARIAGDWRVIGEQSFKSFGAAARAPLAFEIETGAIELRLLDGAEPMTGRMFELRPTDESAPPGPLIVADEHGYVHAGMVVVGRYELRAFGGAEAKTELRFEPIEIERGATTVGSLYAERVPARR